MPLATAATPVAGGWSLDLATALADGANTLIAGESDAAGNSGQSEPRGLRRRRARTRGGADRPRPGITAHSSPGRTHPTRTFSAVVVRRGTAIVYQGRGESLNDKGLFNGTVYTYTFTAVDLAGNVSTIRSVKVKPRGRL